MGYAEINEDEPRHLSKAKAAERYANKGDYNKAIELYTGLVHEYPGNEYFIKNLAYLFKKTNRVNDAAQMYLLLFKKEIMKLKQQGKYELSQKALKQYYNIQSIHPRDPMIYVRLGQELMVYGKPEWAKKEALKALETDPQCSDAYILLAQYYQKQREIRKAVEALEKSVAINPDNCRARNNLGGLYLQMYRYNDAEKELKKAIEIKGDSAHSYYNLAVLYLQRKEYDRTIYNLQKTLEYNPLNINAIILLADVYFAQKKDFRKALSLYYRAMDYTGLITGSQAIIIQKKIANIEELLKKK